MTVASSTSGTPMIRRALALLLGLCALCLASPAFAAGRTQWKSTKIKELSSGGWKLDLKIIFSKAPDVAHVPLKFSFTPTMVYERSIVDGGGKEGKIVLNRKRLSNQMPKVESVTAGFIDPGTGKTAKGTRFTFKLTRGRGYEAGEYKVKITHGTTGRTIGRPVTLVLQGENKAVDRRTMVFSGGEKKKKGDGEKKPGPDANTKTGAFTTAEGEEIEDTPEEDESGDKGGDGDSGEGDVEDDFSDVDPDGEVKEKPGGCGCRTAGSRGSSHSGGYGLLGLAGLLLVRRRS